MPFFGIDHVDSRVSDLKAVEIFYDRFLPWVGLTRRRYVVVNGDEWTYVTPDQPYNAVEYVEEPPDDRAARFFGVVEDRAFKPSLTRISFGMEAGSDLDAVAAFLQSAGARNVEISSNPENYPAVFFEDPLGARFEIRAAFT